MTGPPADPEAVIVKAIGNGSEKFAQIAVIALRKAGLLASVDAGGLEGRLNRIRAAVLSDPLLREDGAKALRDFMLRETEFDDSAVVEGFVPVESTEEKRDG